jgi:glycosyltransferase involved in cell wall biosynthesis
LSLAKRNPQVLILLCTYQGDRFLVEQLDSISQQDHQNILIWVSDDGSQDKTHQILDRYQSLWGRDRFVIFSGPQQGCVENFHSLLGKIDFHVDFIAYADQDDIWETDKLTRAIAKLEDVADGVPALYCSRTRLINETNDELGFSPIFKKAPSFANALVQNIGGGNTMVMNQPAQILLQHTSKSKVVCHDWWAYILISGSGGVVFYDSHPTVNYRQHDRNVIGSNCGWFARVRRLQGLIKFQLRNWVTVNTLALQKFRHLLLPENQRKLDDFCKSRDSWLLARLWWTVKAGVYRQTLLGNTGLIFAVLLKRV